MDAGIRCTFDQHTRPKTAICRFKAPERPLKRFLPSQGARARPPFQTLFVRESPGRQ